MDWGIYLVTARPPGFDEAQVIANSVEYALTAEKLGYSHAWVMEHHFTGYGLIGSPLTHAAYLLGRTTRLRIGTAINVLPLEHPIRVAEEVALLDHLSGGRLMFGVGRGIYRKDYLVFGADMSRNREALAEGVELMIKAWTQPEVGSDSTIYQFPSVQVNPKPLTKPHPPVYSSASSPDSVEWAARLGLPMLLNYAINDEAKKAQLDLYAETAEAAGHDSSKIPHALSLLAGASKDGEIIKMASEKHLEWWLDESTRAGLMFGEGREKVAGYEWYYRLWEEWVMKGHTKGASRVRPYFDINPIGSTQECVDKLGKTLEITGVKQAVMAFEAAGQRELILDSMELFTKEVLVHFD